MAAPRKHHSRSRKASTGSSLFTILSRFQFKINSTGSFWCKICLHLNPVLICKRTSGCAGLTVLYLNAVTKKVTLANTFTFMFFYLKKESLPRWIRWVWLTVINSFLTVVYTTSRSRFLWPSTSMRSRWTSRQHKSGWLFQQSSPLVNRTHIDDTSNAQPAGQVRSENK